MCVCVCACVPVCALKTTKFPSNGQKRALSKLNYSAITTAPYTLNTNMSEPSYNCDSWTGTIQVSRTFNC